MNSAYLLKQLTEAGVIGPFGIPGINVHHLAATDASANKQERGQETAITHTPNMAGVIVMVLVWRSIQENVNLKVKKYTCDNWLCERKLQLLITFFCF